MALWLCPRCISKVEAVSEARLYWAVSGHIRDHEDAAAIKAVDRARMCCPMHDCRLGMNITAFGTRIAGLTDFDLKLLREMKVLWDENQLQ